LQSRARTLSATRADIGENYARAIADFDVTSCHDHLTRDHLLRVMRDPNAPAEMGFEAAKMAATYPTDAVTTHERM
jgi:hypothetical protein